MAQAALPPGFIPDPPSEDKTELPPGFIPDEPSSPPPAASARTWGDTAVDVGIGAAKGLGNTVFGLGKMARDYTPIGRISDAILPGAFDQRPPEITPTNTAQQVGFAGEQIGEFFIPTASPGKLQALVKAPRLVKAGVQAVQAGGLTLAQTDSPTAAVTSAALAAIPGERVAKWVGGKLEGQATKQVQQALGASKERFKAMADKLVPRIIQEGLWGSREKILKQAQEQVASVGAKLDDILQKHAHWPVKPQVVINELEKAKDAFRTVNAAGKVVEFEPRAIRQLDELQAILADLGPNTRVDQLVAVRRAWDEVVDQAGGFAHRAAGAIGVPLKDTSEAAAKLEATTAIRELLSVEVPDLAAINKEWSFWKKLNDVLTQTVQRKGPQGPGLVASGAKIAGAAIGAEMGMPHGLTGAAGAAVFGAWLMKEIHAAIQSPAWKTASALVKDRLARALVSNNIGQIRRALSPFVSAAPSQVQQQTR